MAVNGRKKFEDLTKLIKENWAMESFFGHKLKYEDKVGYVSIENGSLSTFFNN